MHANQVNGYIGKRWRLGARGPDEYDCWGLLLQLHRAHFGVDIADVPLGDPMRALFAERMACGAWRLLPMPLHGAAVLMRGGDDPHVGMYLDLDGGGVLHAMEGVGVIFTQQSALRLQGFSRITYYQLNNG